MKTFKLKKKKKIINHQGQRHNMINEAIKIEFPSLVFTFYQDDVMAFTILKIPVSFYNISSN